MSSLFDNNQNDLNPSVSDQRAAYIDITGNMNPFNSPTDSTQRVFNTQLQGLNPTVRDALILSAPRTESENLTTPHSRAVLYVGRAMWSKLAFVCTLSTLGYAVIKAIMEPESLQAGITTFIFG